MSLWFRNLGWLLLAAWIAGIAGYAAIEVWNETASLVSRLIAFGGVSAAALLFLSVAIDRWGSYKIDRYKGVRK